MSHLPDANGYKDKGLQNGPPQHPLVGALAGLPETLFSPLWEERMEKEPQLAGSHLGLLELEDARGLMSFAMLQPSAHKEPEPPNLGPVFTLTIQVTPTTYSFLLSLSAHLAVQSSSGPTLVPRREVKSCFFLSIGKGCPGVVSLSPLPK